MGCPVHIWVPMMAALAPVARVARDRFLASKPRLSRPTRDVRTLQRFAPVASRRSEAATTASATTEQAR